MRLIQKQQIQFNRPGIFFPLNKAKIKMPGLNRAFLFLF
jgi:hypothetical protein